MKWLAFAAAFLAATQIFGLTVTAAASIVAGAVVAAFGVGVVFGAKGWR